jgi:hypothetical protein
MLRRSLAAGLFLIAALPAFAATIVTVSGGTGSSSGVGEAYATWTQTSAYSNVTITANLFSNGGTATGTAFLTTAVGPGATSATQIATTPISISNLTGTPIQLFTGLTLPAGTYYLVIYASGIDLVWQGLDGTVTTTFGTGVTNSVTYAGNNTENGGYPPGSVFNAPSSYYLQFSATGTLSVPPPAPSVPALTPTAMLAAALLLLLTGLWLMRKPRRVA